LVKEDHHDGGIENHADERRPQAGRPLRHIGHGQLVKLVELVAGGYVDGQNHREPYDSK
jgi:hypothetical protein